MGSVRLHERYDQIMDCWAACLGDCAEGQSREHYISDGIFDGAGIIAFGLKWCKEHPVEIGLESAVARILCKRHNESLSRFDEEAAKLSRFLSTAVLEEPLSPAELKLSGPLLEKWALKTVVNLGYVGALDPERHVRVQPDQTIVRYLFCGAEPPEGVGLYFVTGGTITNQGFKVGLRWNGIRNMSGGGAIVGMSFSLNDVRFLVTTAPGPAERRLARVGVVGGVDYSNADILYRPTNIALRSQTAAPKTVLFEW